MYAVKYKVEIRQDIVTSFIFMETLRQNRSTAAAIIINLIRYQRQRSIAWLKLQITVKIENR